MSTRRKRPLQIPLDDKRFVFVSHSSEDTWVACQIAEKISSVGARCFLDERDIKIGADFGDEIMQALSRAHEWVVLLTPSVVAKPSYVSFEAGVAMQRGILMVVILNNYTLKKFQTDPKIPIFLKKLHTIHINDFHKYLVELKGRIEENDD